MTAGETLSIVTVLPVERGTIARCVDHESNMYRSNSVDKLNNGL